MIKKRKPSVKAATPKQKRKSSVLDRLRKLNKHVLAMVGLTIFILLLIGTVCVSWFLGRPDKSDAETSVILYPTETGFYDQWEGTSGGSELGCYPLDLDFEGLPLGTVLNEQYTADGIHIEGIGNEGKPNEVIIFDSNSNSTPNSGLEVDIGNLAILPYKMDDNNGDGLVDDPKSSDKGGIQVYTFDHDRYVESVTIVEGYGNKTWMFIAYDESGAVIKTVTVSGLEKKEIKTVEIEADGVRRLEIHLEKTGGVAEIKLACEPPPPPVIPPCQPLDLDFEGLPLGTILNEQYELDGIHIEGIGNEGKPNEVIIFDSNSDSSENDSLEVDIGNLAILPYKMDDNNGDGLVDKPKSSDKGGIQVYTFDHDRYVESVTIVEGYGNKTWTFIAYDESGAVIKTVTVSGLEKKEIKTVEIEADGVRRLEIHLEKTGGVAEIKLACEPPHPYEPSCYSAWSVEADGDLYFASISEENDFLNPEGRIIGIQESVNIEALAVAENRDIYIMNNGANSVLYRIPGLELDGSGVTDPEAQQVGNTGVGGVTEKISSLVFMDGLLYGMGRDSKKIYQIDTTNASLTQVGQLTDAFFRAGSMTRGADGTVYLVKSKVTNSELWAFDQFPNGTVHHVFTVTNSGEIEAMSAHPDGTLVMADQSYWYQIDPQSQTFSVIQEQVSEVKGMDFHWSSEEFCVPAEPCNPNQELIVNGGFELPVGSNPAGWDIVPNGTSGLSWQVEWVSGQTEYQGYPRPAVPLLERMFGFSGWDASEGSQHAELDSDWDGPSGSLDGEPASVRISQNLQTVPGRRYRVTFDFSPRPGQSTAQNVLEFAWNGEVVDILTGEGGVDVDWQSYAYEVIAESEVTQISFADRGIANSYGTFLDNVSVRCISASCMTNAELRIDYLRVANQGNGNAVNTTFVGEDAEPVADHAVIPLTDGMGYYWLDNGLNVNVPGLALQRGEGYIRLALKGKQQTEDLEIVDSMITFHDARISGFENDAWYPLENQGDGMYKDMAGQDEVFPNVGETQALSYMRVNTHLDGFYLYYTCQETAVCGDGFIDEGEACDDGNRTDGDGCSATCVLEDGCRTVQFLQPIEFVDDDTSGWSAGDAVIDTGKKTLSILNGMGEVDGYIGGQLQNISHRGTRGLGVIGGRKNDEIDNKNAAERIELHFHEAMCITDFEIRSLFPNQGPNGEPEEARVKLFYQGVTLSEYRLLGSAAGGAYGSIAQQIPTTTVDQVSFFVQRFEPQSAYSAFALANVRVCPCEGGGHGNPPGDQCQPVTLFPNDLPPGTILREQLSEEGIHVRGIGNGERPNEVIIFDSNASGTPNINLEVGIDNLSVLPYDITDLNGDGLVDVPNDSDVGGWQVYTFDHDRFIDSFLFVNKQGDEEGIASVYDGSNNLLSEIAINPGTPGQIQTIDVNTDGARKMVIEYFETGGVGDVSLMCSPVSGGLQMAIAGVTDKTIKICHFLTGDSKNIQTIDIPESAWSFHAKHGDRLGACEEACVNCGKIKGALMVEGSSVYTNKNFAKTSFKLSNGVPDGVVVTGLKIYARARKVSTVLNGEIALFYRLNGQDIVGPNQRLENEYSTVNHLFAGLNLTKEELDNLEIGVINKSGGGTVYITQTFAEVMYEMSDNKGSGIEGQPELPRSVEAIADREDEKAFAFGREQNEKQEIPGIETGPEEEHKIIAPSCSAQVKFTAFLSEGSTNIQVRPLQHLLQCLGYFPNNQTLTRRYGPLTTRAVRAFQRDHGIRPVGYVGPATRAALNAYR